MCVLFSRHCRHSPHLGDVNVLGCSDIRYVGAASRLVLSVENALMFQDAMQVMLFYYSYRQATPSMYSISPSPDQISFLILNSFTSSSTGITATISVIAQVNQGEHLLNRLETHFKTSSMAMTGALINKTACHSCQFNGVIWNRVLKNGT